MSSASANLDPVGIVQKSQRDGSQLRLSHAFNALRVCQVSKLSSEQAFRGRYPYTATLSGAFTTPTQSAHSRHVNMDMPRQSGKAGDAERARLTSSARTLVRGQWC